MTDAEFTPVEEEVKAALNQRVVPGIKKLAAYKHDLMDHTEAGVDRLLAADAGAAVRQDVRIADAAVPHSVRDAARNHFWSGSVLKPGEERWPHSGGMRPEQEEAVLAELKKLTKRPPDNVGIKGNDLPLIMQALREDGVRGAEAAEILARGNLSGSKGLWEVASQLQQDDAGSALMALRYGEELKAQGHAVAFEQKNGKIYDIDVATLGPDGAIASAAQLKDMRGPMVTEEKPAYPGYIVREIPNRLGKAVGQLFEAPGSDRRILLDVHEPHVNLTQQVLDNVQKRATAKGIPIQIRFSDGMDLTVNPA